MASTFVTVAHEVDEFLLGLQARSFARYVAEDQVSAILVVENFTPSIDMDRAGWRARLLARYAQHAPKVRFLTVGGDLARPPHASGWWTQQVLKLTVSAEVKTDRYVVLDAKNVFSATLRDEFLTAPDGRALTRRYGYAGHPLRGALERTYRFMGVDPTSAVERSLPTATPFTLFTAAVRSLVNNFGGAEPLAATMIRQQLTEFFLYTAYLTRCDLLDHFYADGQPPCPVLWDYQGGVMAALHFVADVERQNAPMCAVHRRALAEMDRAGREVIAQLWVRLGLADFICPTKDAMARAFAPAA